MKTCPLCLDLYLFEAEGISSGIVGQNKPNVVNVKEITLHPDWGQ
jgi:hypothetical protein